MGLVDLDEMVLAGEYRATVASIREIRNQVAAFAATHGADLARVEDVRLVVSEAVSNVVLHAYHDQPLGRLELLAIAGGGELVVSIEDSGWGLSRPSGRSGLGSGVHVMRELARDALIAERELGGCTAQLRFTLKD